MTAVTQTPPFSLSNTQRVRRPWLWRLEQALKARHWESFLSSLSFELDRLAREDGLVGEDASRVALRTAQLCILLLAGLEQREAAGYLGVSERTGSPTRPVCVGLFPAATSRLRPHCPSTSLCQIRGSRNAIQTLTQEGPRA